MLLGTLSLVTSSANAWQLTAYNSDDCWVSSATTYRVLFGPSTLNNCFTFQQDMPGTGCTHFTNGGANNGPCTSAGFTAPWSVWVRGTCTIFSEANCSGGKTAVVGDRQCGILPGAIGILPRSQIRSYRCSGSAPGAP
ncbi:hypothetical protein QBC44DRAFT_363614 [Cladorrhinum sp. PSN332]|nr:hypothetical protein QBC44DRAFT_363614 [Cladorrhinum sp. PSN332]